MTCQMSGNGSLIDGCNEDDTGTFTRMYRVEENWYNPTVQNIIASVFHCLGQGKR